MCSSTEDTVNCPFRRTTWGRVIQTAEQEHIDVRLREVDELDRVLLCEKGSDR